jgi:hypothetical protein
MTKEESDRYIRNLASRATRLSVEDWHIPSFSKHEKTIIDNMEFLYWMVQLAKIDEREACAKVCDTEWNGDSDTFEYAAACNECAEAIRARKKA